MSLWWSHYSLSTAGARRDPVCVGPLAPPSWLRSPLGLVACKAYVFQWGYDGKQPSIVSLGTTFCISGNQLEDDGSSVCVLSLTCIGSSHPSWGWCRFWDEVAVVCNPIRMGRLSELIVVCVCHSDEVMRETDANDTSGELDVVDSGLQVKLTELWI